MKILVIGGGGREHALAWRLAQSPRVQTIHVAPGNGGTARDKRLKNVPITDLEQLADYAIDEGIELTARRPGGTTGRRRGRQLPASAPAHLDRRRRPRSSRA